MRRVIASLFRWFFKIPGFNNHFYGIHKHIFQKIDLLSGLSKTITTKNGLRFQLRLDDWIQENIFFLDEYEHEESEFLKRNLKESDVVVDIGANIGYHSLLAASLVGGSGQIYSFEPLEENFRSFLRNIKLNSFDNVHAFNLGVSDKPKILNLYLNSEKGNMGMASEFGETNNHLHQTIEAIDMDTFFKKHPVQKIDVIKIDIEGGEYPALLGMKNTLDRFSPYILIELDDAIINKTPYSKKDIVDFLIDLNYQKFYLAKDGVLALDENAGISKNVVFKPHKDS